MWFNPPSRSTSADEKGWFNPPQLAAEKESGACSGIQCNLFHDVYLLLDILFFGHGFR